MSGGKEYDGDKYCRRLEVEGNGPDWRKEYYPRLVAKEQERAKVEATRRRQLEQQSTAKAKSEEKVSGSQVQSDKSKK